MCYNSIEIHKEKEVDIMSVKNRRENTDIKQDNNENVKQPEKPAPEKIEEQQDININTEKNQNININIHSDGAQNVTAESDEDYETDLSGELKSDYQSDNMKEVYYRESWFELCEEAGTKKTEDVKFMDILIQTLRDTHKQKQAQKRKYFFWERSLLILAFVNTLLNALNLYQFGYDISVYLDFTCVAISAMVVAITSYKMLTSPKDSWLRHMAFYVKATTEADNLFGGGIDYISLSPAEKIAAFKSKIVKYTQEDYQDFIVNLNGSKTIGTQDDTKL